MAISLPSRQPSGYSDVTSPFAMDDHAFRALGHRLVDTLGAYLEALPENPVYQPLPDEVRRQIEEMGLPAKGIEPEAIWEFFTQRVLPYGRGQNHPCFAAFVDPAASKLSMLAAFASAVTNTSGAGGEYAAIYLEQLAVRWLMELIGFPRDGSDGVLLGGGSDANRHCMEVARHWGARVNGWDIRDEGLQGHPRLTMYMSTEGHSCLEKAAFTLGLGSPRKVAVDHDFRMDLNDLRAAVAADRRVGHRPFLVAANAGSVKTGAIDPLDDLAEFCRQERLWLHVDGAYGGFGVLDPRLAPRFAGMERADSVALDPHKWMAVAIGCSCAMVRQGELLQETFKLVPSYLSLPQGGFAGHIWYSHRSAEQTRDSGRALKTFWNIQQAGKAGLVSHVRRHIDLARHMERLIEASPDLELLAIGPLTAVCFRYVPTNWQGNDQGLDLLNQTIMGDVQTGGRAFLAGTDIRGRFALRSCALHYALNEGHVETILSAVREAGALRVSAGLAVPVVTPQADAGRAPARPARGGLGGLGMGNPAGPNGSRTPAAAAGAKNGHASTRLAEQVRFALALAAGKGSGAAGRLLSLGGGTSFPGAIARRIDPLVLQKVATANKVQKAVITGSNGKTTSCRMLAALAEAAGTSVAQNRSGSNLLQGVTSVAVREADLRGRIDARLLLLEVDEATMPRVAPEVAPDMILITNVFRDQLDRFGELYSMARMLESAIEALPAHASVVLNGDDPLVASLAPHAKARRLYFGLRAEDVGAEIPEHAADSIRCVHCQHALTYRRAYLSHLGDYECRGCGSRRPDLDIAITHVQASADGGADITAETPAGTVRVHVPLPGLHNVYNAAAALAGAFALGALEPRSATSALTNLRPAFGRLEEITADGRQLVLSFVKNPASYNANLRLILRRPGRKHVLAAHSNTAVDGEDFAWLWDVDLEQLVPDLASLVVSGTRAEEVALRMKYAGANLSDIRVIPGRQAALDTALARIPPDEPLYILAGYTPMREFRQIMQRRGWVQPFWEE